MCAGPWRPVRLETYVARIKDLWSSVMVEKDLKLASGTLFATVDGPADRAHFSLKLEDRSILEKTVAVGSDGLARVDIRIEGPVLWFPHGYGNQPLYTLTAKALVDDTVLDDTMTKKIGLRRAELIQDDDDVGRSFYFRINNIDIFCGGSCWIPADSFIPRISTDKYRKWLQIMVDGGQVMTR
jgi:beta-mannosidase